MQICKMPKGGGRQLRRFECCDSITQACCTWWILLLMDLSDWLNPRIQETRAAANTTSEFQVGGMNDGRPMICLLRLCGMAEYPTFSLG
jgi:hypothetical protein